jgi:biopolymer transport protein TolR
MAMTTGGGGIQAQINMTPMIDVLLVLIIIFMVITPTVSRGLETAIPQQAQDPATPEVSRDIVISVLSDGGFSVNREPIERAALGPRLAALYRAGRTNHLFVRGDRELEFQEIAQVIDVARGAGWERIGLMTR